MLVSDFDFNLDPSRIAQEPPSVRGTSRMLVLDRRTGAVAHSVVADLPQWLAAGDLLVLNETRVFPARLHGHRDPSGGHVECLLLRRLDDERWDVLVHPGQKLKPGARIVLGTRQMALQAEVIDRRTFGRRTIRLFRPDGGSVDEAIDALGEMPLPPYIKRPASLSDRERYQTVYARVRGSVAAPTAGLHLTESILEDLQARGVERTAITLHVGYGTFQPVRVDTVEDHRIDPEHFEIGHEAARRITATRRAGRRIVSVGTTTTRTLEARARAHEGVVAPGSGEADVFIYPGFEFQIVSALLTNFHLPKSSLLMLVCAFAGRAAVLGAYREALEQGYRFYSYGDAMLII
jgi:S-adenosylmethionine:tRNA ribosyltransferase-isomerase